MGKKRRRFTEEFKREAVRLAFSGERPVREVGDELGVRPDMLQRWQRELAAAERPAPASELELARLHRELREVREERDILKKALAIFSDRRP